MIDTFGPRQPVTGIPAAGIANGDPGERVVHRPADRVLPAERVDRTSPTGPRPTFRQTYLERIAALWPKEPEPAEAPRKHHAPVAETRQQDGPVAFPAVGEPPPGLDIRR